MVELAIRTEALTYEHAPGVGAVDLDLAVPTGSVYGFLGPNGAGKSTAMRLLYGMVRPHRGDVDVLGLDPWGDAAELHGHIGVLASDQPAPRHHTGRSLLALVARLRRRADVVERGASLAERLELNLDKHGHELSLGNRQKLGLVLALAHDPDLVILDEPTSGLDPLLQREIRQLLREIAETGRTVMLSSHSLPEVEAVADVVGFIRDSRLVVQAPLADIAEHASRRVVLGFTDPVDTTRFGSLDGVDRVEVNDEGEVTVVFRGPVAAVLGVAAELDAQTIDAHPVDLEDTFLALYRGETTEHDTGNGEDVR